MASTRSISVRLDARSNAALAALRDRGMSPSEAIRYALAETLRASETRSALRAEVARVAADEADRRELAEVGALMDELSDPW